MASGSKAPEPGLVQEGLIFGAFLVLCGLAAWTVALPALEDHADEPEVAAGEVAAGEPDAGER